MAGSFVIHAQYVKDLSFENPKALEAFKLQEAPAFNISLDIGVNQLDDKTYEVVMTIEIKANIENDTLFVIALDYAGVFTVDITDQEELKQALMIECPKYLFPYVRHLVADITHRGGYLPLNLHPIDFKELYLQKLQADTKDGVDNNSHN